MHLVPWKKKHEPEQQLSIAWPLCELGPRTLLPHFTTILSDVGKWRCYTLSSCISANYFGGFKRPTRNTYDLLSIYIYICIYIYISTSVFVVYTCLWHTNISNILYIVYIFCGSSPERVGQLQGKETTPGRHLSGFRKQTHKNKHKKRVPSGNLT